MTEPEQLEEWYVTFDPEDLHPVTGQSMGGTYIILNGDRDTARREACRRFGDQWAALLPRAETDAGGGPPGEPLAPEGLWAGEHEKAHVWEAIYGPTYDGRR